MDADSFTEGMNLLSAVFDPDTISAGKVEARFKAYRLVLGGLDGAAFLEACLWATTRYTFFPKPAELLAYRTEAEAAALAEEKAERRRLRGAFYEAWVEATDARGSPHYRDALARFRDVSAAYHGVEPEALGPDPLLLEAGELDPEDGPDDPPPGPPRIDRGALREAVIDLAERKAMKGAPSPRRASGE